MRSASIQRSSARPGRRRQRHRGRRWAMLLMVPLAASVIAPLYWATLIALRSGAEVYAVPPKMLPVDLDLTGVLDVISGTPFIVWMENSLIVAVSSSIIAIAVGVPAGYALSRFTTRTTRSYAGGILITQMMPPILLLVPVFVIFKQLHLVNTLLGLILVDTALVLPMAIWMSKAMIDQIPRELDEAAMVDGCSYWSVLLTVIVPIARPALIGIVIYAFIEVWDEFLFAKTLIASRDFWPASVGLYSFQGADFVPINQVMFVALIFTAVPLICFLLARRSLIASMTAGAVKG